MNQQKEVIVLGAGPAGYVCAIRLAQLGKKVTIIDKAEVGGVCLNRGCIPSKALIHAGGLFEKMSHADELGIEVGKPKVNLPKLMKWKDSVVQKLTSGVSTLLKANGCEVISGEAKLTGSHSLEVKTASGVLSLSFQQLVLATGSRPAALPKIEGVDQKQILDSTGALTLQKLPESMVCIGGGYIGLELGMVYAKLGTKVTVIEAGPSLLAGVDPALTQVVMKKLTKLGVTVHLKAQLKELKKKAKSVEVSFSDGSKEDMGLVKTESEVVLMTIGRTPNTENLGLEKAGLKVDAKGFLTVDAQRRTSVSHIYAIGDIAGQPLLAHKGSKEGMVAAEAIAGQKSAYDIIAMPAVIFTDPEIATVGMTEAEANAKGIEIQIGIFPFAANGRALSVAETDGFVKMIGEKKTGRLLGVHIVGVEASNLISEAALALEMGAHVEDVALTVHPHPTLPEALMEAAEATLGHAIHIKQKVSGH